MAKRWHFCITLSYIPGTYLASILCLPCVFFPACLPPLKNPYCFFRNYSSVPHATVVTFASAYFGWSPSVTVKHFSLDFGLVCSALKKGINNDSLATFSFQRGGHVCTDRYFLLHFWGAGSVNDWHLRLALVHWFIFLIVGWSEGRLWRCPVNQLEVK